MVEIAKSENVDSATPKMLDRWHQSWHRDKKDLKAKFLNLSTMVGNIFLLIALLTVLGLVNRHMVCVPESLFLNPAVVNITGCNHLNVSGLLMNSTAQRPNSTQDGAHPEPTTFYELNLFVLCIIVPLGLASILISLSEEWMPSVQKLRCIIKGRRAIHLEVDGILAGSAILSTLLFAIFLVPVAVNATILNHFKSCYIELILNIISTVALFLIGLPSIFYFGKNIATLRKGSKQMQTEIKNELQEIYEEGGKPEMKFLARMVLTFLAWTVILVITSLRFSETAQLSQLEEQNQLCSRNLGLQLATMVLHVTDVVILIVSTFESVFFAVHYVLYRKSRKPQPNDPEMIPLA